MLSDTHIRAGSSRRLPDRVYEALQRADLILHAGDVVAADLLDELGGFAPVRAVLGNNDVDLAGALPIEQQFDVDGVRLAMVHDSGARAGRAARMQRRFPNADVVVFGHSHEPVDEEGLDGQRLFNPGSPTQRRRQAHHTIGLIRVDRGRLRNHAIVVVD